MSSSVGIMTFPRYGKSFKSFKIPWFHKLSSHHQLIQWQFDARLVLTLSPRLGFQALSELRTWLDHPVGFFQKHQKGRTEKIANKGRRKSQITTWHQNSYLQDLQDFIIFYRDIHPPYRSPSIHLCVCFATISPGVIDVSHLSTHNFHRLSLSESLGK